LYSFMGRLICDYLSRKLPFETIKWAIGGRNFEKLLSLKQQLCSRDLRFSSLQIIEAKYEDFFSIVNMCKKTQIILNCAGPYINSAEILIQGCIETYTDYCDISREIPFIMDIIKRYHDVAFQKNIVIALGCGFNSVIADLSTLLIRSQFTSPDQLKSLQIFLSVEGSLLSTGFISTITTSIADYFTTFKNHNYFLNYYHDKQHFTSNNSSHIVINREPHYNPFVNKWVIPLPSSDDILIRRSTQLSGVDINQDFQLGYYLNCSSFLMYLFTLFILLLFGCFYRFVKLRRYLYEYIDEATKGSSEIERNSTNFKLTLVGGGTSDTKNQKEITGEIVGIGIGICDLTKFLATEVALSLLFNRDDMAIHGGVVNPATVTGKILIKRLEKTGVLKFSILNENTV